MIRVLALLCLAGMLAACSSHPAPAEMVAVPAAPASATTNALAGTPMATYGHALNRAKNVQNVVDQAAARQAKAIDAATGSSSP
ncbi:MAG TPA: hypothetical protein VFP92_07365 [Rhodanobacteraceae bacterium]|nr:hypothetical protein [Rhodanobacteraceae bacterium]